MHLHLCTQGFRIIRYLKIFELVNLVNYLFYMIQASLYGIGGSTLKGMQKKSP